MPINTDTLNSIISGLNAMPKKSEIDTASNNIDLLATETSEGLMSAEDKVKLNRVETGANNYVLPSAGKDSLGGVKTTSDVNSTDGYVPTPIIDGVPYYKNTLYTLPIATTNTLGGVKIGKNISISEDGAISVSDVSADQMTGIVPINKGGTGASNIHQARINLKTSCFVIVGNTTENDETNSGYYQAFSVPTIASVQYTLRLLISPVTPSYDFEEFTVDIKLNTSASEKLTPVGYMSTVEEQYDVINKLYVAYNASITTGGFYFWYKNTSTKSAIRISVLSCTYSNDITQDGLQTISLNTSGACTSQDTISTSTPNVVLFSDIITTKLATSSMAGYMSKEDKAKLDALDSTLTEQASQLTSLVNNAYNTIGSPSTTTTTSTDSSDIPYNETRTTVKYEFSKPNGGKSTVSSTDTVIKYKNASSSNAGLLSSADYDYIHSLPDTLSALEEAVTNDITTTLDAHVTDTNNPHSVTKSQIGLGNVENKTSATIRNEITKANVTTALGYTPVTPTEFTTHIDEFDAHVANVSNPHSVTKAQIGLGNVENKTSEDIRGELTSTNVTDALTYTPAKATDLTSHISNKSNPHSVTKAQIGLGNVENKTSEDIRGELTATNITTALGYTPVTPTDLSDHMSDTNNPHSVTKAQIGLGNVENKSSAAIRGELTKANVTTALGYTPPSSVTFTQSITSGTKIGTLNVSGTGVDLYAPADIDTHWTSNLVVGASSTASSNETAGNGNVHLNLFENSTIRNSHKISGANGVTVTSNADGEIAITGTTYTAGTGLALSGTKFNHSNSVTAGTAQGDSDKTLEFGGTFDIPTVTYDAQGHITGSGTTTLTMPSNPNTDTKVTSTLATTTKAYITGTTSATTNTGTLVFDTGVYLDTNTGVLNAKDFKENGIYLANKYKVNKQGAVGQGSPVSDPWFKFAYMTLTDYKNYDHNTTFKVFRGFADYSKALGMLTAHVRTSSDGKFFSGELVWEYAGEGITLSDFKLAYSPDTNPLQLELWVKVTQEWARYHFDYITAGNRTATFNGTGWTFVNAEGNGSASITEGYVTIDSTLLKLKNPIADNQYLPIVGGAMTGNIGYKGSMSTKDMIRFIDNALDANGNGIAIGGGGLTIIGGGESAYTAESLFTSGDSERMLVCNDYEIDFYSDCQSGMTSSKHYTMSSGVITSESFNATSSYKINDKVAIQYNSTEECVNFVFS